MFNEFKIVKIIIFVLLLVFIIPKQLEKYKNTHIFFKPIALTQRDSLNFFISSNSNQSSYNLTFENLITKQTALDTMIKVKKTFDYFDIINVLKDGFPGYEKTIYNPLTIPGIYTCNNENSFVLTGGFKSDLTVVCPLITNQFYQSSQGVQFFKSKLSSISLNRDVPIDPWTEGLLPLFSVLENKYKVNYVSDLDLESKKVFNQTKVILLYGKTTFWSQKMMQNINDFVDSGGKVLIASSSVFYAGFCADLNANKLSTSNCINKQKVDVSKVQSWRGLSSDSNMIFNHLHSDFGGVVIDTMGLIVLDSANVLFDNIKFNNNLLPFKGDNYIGIPVKYTSSIEYTPLHNSNILAYVKCESKSNGYNIGGVIECDYNNGGKILSLGTSDWCLKKNQKLENTKNLFLNSIHYLINNN